MYPVCTTYAGEVAPARSRRETVSLRSVPHFLCALGKANSAERAALNIPRLVIGQQPVNA
jgi:hypothetical protein